MQKIKQQIVGSQVDGWVTVTPLTLDHANYRPLNYDVIRPDQPTNKAIFYLHGLGGNRYECEIYDDVVVNKLGYALVRMEHILMTFDDFAQAAGVIGGIAARPGAIFVGIHNTSKVIDAIAQREGFEAIGIVGVSYGGFATIVNAIHGQFAKRVMLCASTPDIAFAIEQFPMLFPEGWLRELAKVGTTTITTEARNIRRGEGLFRGDWDRINPWTRPRNPEVRIYCIGNENDPLMSGSSLRLYQRWMAENMGFENIANYISNGGHYHGVTEEFVNIPSEIASYFEDM
ncbi:MAG: hypothetical protein H6540_09715 [Bacteroidales bacterium]|nr:hypothetical protein [Bacteroidales bacterium]